MLICDQADSHSHAQRPAAFMKINSTLPSSAAVERLSSAAAAQVLTVRHRRMSDETLDQHIFLRSQFNE